jgi:hypothetical protein
LVVLAEGKKTRGTPRRRRESNTDMDLERIGWNRVNWINLAEDRNQRRDLVIVDISVLKHVLHTATTALKMVKSLSVARG